MVPVGYGPSPECLPQLDHTDAVRRNRPRNRTASAKYSGYTHLRGMQHLRSSSALAHRGVLKWRLRWTKSGDLSSAPSGVRLHGWVRTRKLRSAHADFTACLRRGGQAWGGAMHPITVRQMKFDVPSVDEFHPLCIAGSSALSYWG